MKNSFKFANNEIENQHLRRVEIKHGYGYGWPDMDTDERIKHG